MKWRHLVLVSISGDLSTTRRRRNPFFPTFLHPILFVTIEVYLPFVTVLGIISSSFATMRGDFVDRSIENSCNLYSIFETVWFLFGGRTSHLIGIFSVSPTHRTFVLCVSLVPPIPYHDDRLRGEPTLKLEWTNKYAVITYTDFFAANWLAASDDS